MKLGTLDWGIGGLDVHTRLVGSGLGEAAVYLSDAGATPYGKMTAEALAMRVASVLRQLGQRGCSHVMVGCNAACSVLDRREVQAAAEAFEAVVGVAELTVESLSGVPRVTVLAGARTVASEVYAAPLREGGTEVRQRVAQPLSALVERGRLHGPEVHAAIDAVLAPVLDTEVLVLGCTHYAALRPAIEARLPRLQRVVDPAAVSSDVLQTRWPRRVSDQAVDSVYETSGDPAASTAAALKAWGLEAHFVAIAGPSPCRAE